MNAAIIGHVGTFCTSILASYSRTWYIFACFRMLSGIFSHIPWIAGFVMIMESVAPKMRTICGILWQIFYCLGVAKLSIIGYFFPAWRTTQFLLSFYSLLAIAILLYVGDSPRYMILRGKYCAYRNFLKKCHRQISSELSDIDLMLLKSSKLDQEKSYSLIDIFKSGSEMIKVLLVCAFSWYVCSVTFYGIQLGIGKLPGNIFLTNALVGMVPIPGYLLAVFFMVDNPKFGRRKSLAFFFMFSGFCTLVFTLFAEKSKCDKDDFSNPFTLATLVLAMLGKLGIGLGD